MSTASDVQEQLVSTVKQGREAGLVLQLANEIIEENFQSLINNALAAYRGGHMTAERAFVFVGKLDAIIGFREELESRVDIGNAAGEALNQARQAPVLD